MLVNASNRGGTLRPTGRHRPSPSFKIGGNEAEAGVGPVVYAAITGEACRTWRRRDRCPERLVDSGGKRPGKKKPASKN